MPRLPRPVSADPRAMLMDGHADVLTDGALLSVLVGEQGGEGAARILEQWPIPDAIMRVSGQDLVALEGVGPVGAARVLACLEMTRRSSAWRYEKRPTISTPEDVIALCAPQLRGLDREHFWTLLLNTKNRLIRIVEVSVGSLNASIVHPRELYKDAVRLSAASVIVVHNHPSGDPAPSGADIQLTRRLVKAGDVLGIELLDHVVIGSDDHASLRDLGLM